LTLILAATWADPAWNSETLYPQALMNWMVEGTFHAMIVDKSQQRLTVWRIKDGEPSLVEAFRCSTGENDGDKWVRGDMKTPEGVYLFCSVIDGRQLPSKYGYWAFTTDYPNFLDRRRGKSGDGIWLHGRDKPLGDRPDSNGCVALENQDLVRVSRYIRLQDTPLIVVNKLVMAPRSQVLEQERQIRDFIESWRQGWESREVDEYMNHYSANFQSCWLDFKSWKEKKRRLSQRYRKIRVRLGDVYLYRQDGLVTAIFSQTYSSDGFRSSGIKVLYLLTENGQYKIYSEDYHQPVDDPFPVRVLLARMGADTFPDSEKSNDFRIRLVSTDEPEQFPGSGELETPRPSAPSRGVVLDRLAQGAAEEIQIPTLESGERVGGPSSSERLIVAWIVPSYAPADLPHAASPRQAVALAARQPAEQPEVSAQETPRVEKKQPPEGTGFAVALREPLRAQLSDEKKMQDRDPAPTESKAPKTCPRPNDGRACHQFVEKWKKAWEQKDLDTFAKMYHPKFEQGRMDYKAFLKSKRVFFHKYRSIRVEIDRVETRKEKGRLIVTFLQSFQGDDYRDKGWKTMVLGGGEAEGFRILEEQWSPIQGIASNSSTQSP
jgi:murein L,D-transpeptidase YafK